jgi:hypothetical protein
MRTRAAKLTTINEYMKALRREKHLFRKKKEQLDDKALIEIERHRSVQDSRKFYKRLNGTIKPFKPALAMCRATNGQVLSRWKEYFEQHLNDSFEEESHTNKMMLLPICQAVKKFWKP